MEFAELKEFIKEQDKILIDKFGQGKDQEKIVLARIAKLNEEVGELCEAILTYYGDQRQVKIKKFNKEEIAQEVADVVITVLLVGQAYEIDIAQELEYKIKKIKEKYNKYEL